MLAIYKNNHVNHTTEHHGHIEPMLPLSDIYFRMAMKACLFSAIFLRWCPFFSAIYVELKKSCLWIERADVSPVALLEAHHLGMKHIRRPLTKFHSPLLSCNIASHREPRVGRMAEAPCQRSRRSQVQFTLGGLPGHVLNPRGVRGPEFSGSPGSLSQKKSASHGI